MTRSMKIAALLLVLLAVPAGAQQPPATLSLEEAIELAREYNPGYQARLNDESVAQWGLRAAYGAFLPSASVGGGMSYQGGGQPLVGGLTGGDFGIDETPAYYFSSYSAGMSMSLSGASFYQVNREKAGQRQALAGREVAQLTLESGIRRQYMSALRARDAVELAQAELERAELNLSLAEARRAVETATPIETMQAEVERGRAEVELLRAEATYDSEKLRLLEQIGLDLDRGVELTTKVEVFEPTWQLASLVEAAVASHPALAASEASVAAARAGIGMARSSYLPRLSLSAQVSGHTRKVGSDAYLIDQAQGRVLAQQQQCETTNIILARLNPPLPTTDCSQIQFTDAMRDEILAGNRDFPFNFENQPMSLSLGVSVPVFQGLSRQYQLESANAQAEDARHALRAEELRVRADVETAYLTLETAYRAARLEERNRALAAEQLRLAQERYRVGSASFMELSEAETVKARADRAYLISLYAFQDALTALESAVGQDLAIPQN